MPKNLSTNRAGKVKNQTPKVAKTNTYRKDVGRLALRKKNNKRDKLEHINSLKNQQKREGNKNDI